MLVLRFESFGNWPGYPTNQSYYGSSCSQSAPDADGRSVAADADDEVDDTTDTCQFFDDTFSFF